MRKKRLIIWLSVMLFALAAVSVGAYISFSAFANNDPDTGQVEIEFIQNIEVTSPEDAEKQIATSDKGGAHVFVLDVKAKFSSCDIDRKFTLYINFDGSDDTVFECPEGEIYTLSSHAGTVEANVSTMTDGGVPELSVGKTFVGVSADGENFSWSESKVVDGEALLCSGMKVSRDEQIFHFKVIYYIDFKPCDGRFKAPIDPLAYRVICEDDTQ